MPKKRAIMVISFFGRHASIIMTVLAFFVLGLAIASIVQYQQLQNTRSSLGGIEIARIVEQRSQNTSRFRECKNAIPFLVSYNVLVRSYRSDLKQRASANETLVKQTPPGDLKDVREKAVSLARKNAAKLKTFPERTKQDCEDLKAQLRAELEAKYGEKLAQLEKEERASRKEDPR